MRSFIDSPAQITCSVPSCVPRAPPSKPWGACLHRVSHHRHEFSELHTVGDMRALGQEVLSRRLLGLFLWFLLRLIVSLLEHSWKVRRFRDDRHNEIVERLELG
jgi:hypothetical protein